MLGQVLIAEADAFVAMWRDVQLPDGRDRVVRHGHGPERAIQLGSGLSRSGGPRSATAARWARRRKSGSRRRSCRNGRGGRRASMFCFRSCTCRAFRPATPRRPSPLSWGQGRVEPVAPVIAGSRDQHNCNQHDTDARLAADANTGTDGCLAWERATGGLRLLQDFADLGVVVVNEHSGNIALTSHGYHADCSVRRSAPECLQSLPGRLSPCTPNAGERHRRSPPAR